MYTRERGTEQSGGSTNHGRRERAEDPCCGQRVERRPNRRDGGGCPWHDHDHGRQVQERGIRDHEYRHQRGLHPDDTAGGGIFFEDAFLEFTFAAYAPYASGANASTLPGTDGKITVNTSNQPTTTEQEKVDYIHATGAKADKDSPTVSFTDNTAAGGSDCSFKHKMARLILKVQVSNTDGFDDTAVLEFADYKLGGLVHEGTFDVKTGTAATAGSVVSDWMLRQCTGAPKTATDKCVATFDAATGVMTFTMILLPQTLANALVLEISPDDEEYQSYSNKDMIKPALEAGYSYTYTITVKKTGLTLSGSTIENWNDGGSHAGDAKM